jgi:2-keto-3-deoxy-L-rhamnonate aldolase RhmA
MVNLLRQRLDTGPLYGSAVTLRDPAVVEMMGIAGLDFVVVEFEHVLGSTALLHDHLRAARAAHVASLVKIAVDDLPMLSRVLDAGTDGVLLAGARSSSEARGAVERCRYPPVGTRGVLPFTRDAAYGSSGLSGPELMAARNRDLVVGLIVEAPGTVQDVDGILGIEGLDFVFVGPGDLAASMGAPDPAEVKEAIEYVIGRCAASGKRLGVPSAHPALDRPAAELRELGATLFFIGADAPSLVAGLRQRLAAARREAGDERQ